MKIKTGQTAPDFQLLDQNHQLHRLSDYQGQWVLLYFYPQDDTPGCTAEACAIRDNFSDFKQLNIKVLGISTDSVESHNKFIDKYNLPFTLLADDNKEVVIKYDVWTKKKFMGQTYQGVSRTSFLINPQGVIVKIYEKIEPKLHALDVLNNFKHRIIDN